MPLGLLISSLRLLSGLLGLHSDIKATFKHVLQGCGEGWEHHFLR
jgi:hypothetical protein